MFEIAEGFGLSPQKRRSRRTRHSAASADAIVPPASNAETAPEVPDADVASNSDHSAPGCLGQAGSGAIAVCMLPISRIVPSDYNPNEMTEEAFAEYVAEVTRMGRLPKPLVVRLHGNDYAIVDGEHGLKAARKLSFTEVPCEVVDIDDFEAMQQTYKRNRHGDFNQVRLGQMFERMMAGRQLSVRKLAKEINVTEGTVRNAILYAKAANMRNGCAASETGPSISQLGVRQVRTYVKLPDGERDAWLDAGAKLNNSKPATRHGDDEVDSPARCQAEKGPKQAKRGQTTVPPRSTATEMAAPATRTDDLTVTPVSRSVTLDDLQQVWDRAGDDVRQAFLRGLLDCPRVASMLLQLRP